jgi:hypothetical protein
MSHTVESTSQELCRQNMIKYRSTKTLYVRFVTTGLRTSITVASIIRHVCERKNRSATVKKMADRAFRQIPEELCSCLLSGGSYRFLLRGDVKRFRIFGICLRNYTTLCSKGQQKEKICSDYFEYSMPISLYRSPICIHSSDTDSVILISAINSVVN